MKSVIIYVRVSHADQASVSAEAQVRECQDHCDRNGWRVVGTFVDKNVSGAGEWATLRRAADTLDELAALEDAAADAPATVPGSKGQPVANPLFAEIRAHGTTYGALTRALKLPTEAKELAKVTTAERGHLDPHTKALRAARARHG
ncbi:recombinase family protein [Streptomyces sp. NPDC058284]|uniref:recombinase family protein n=1 Tax=unclassified Streptomyces TaxID=2593676 RepID=UPI00366292F8